MNCTPNVRQKNLTFGGVFLMSKYSHELKMEVVKHYTEKHLSLQETAIHFNLAGAEIIVDGNVYIMRKVHKVYI